MALSVDYIYKFALDLMKKNQAGGMKASSFQYQWNDASAAYQDDLLGRFNARNNGKEGVNTGLIENETILQKLAPFTTLGAAIAVSAGNANKPTNFVYRLAMRAAGMDCIKINHNQIASVNNSVIDPPSIADGKYYFVEYQGYYTLLPTATATIDLDYIVSPTDVVWGYTIVDDRQVYNAGTSVQPLWDNNSCREISKRMLKNLGVSFKDNDFANFGQSVIVSGT